MKSRSSLFTLEPVILLSVVSTCRPTVSDLLVAIQSLTDDVPLMAIILAQNHQFYQKVPSKLAAEVLDFLVLHVANQGSVWNPGRFLESRSIVIQPKGWPTINRSAKLAFSLHLLPVEIRTPEAAAQLVQLVDHLPLPVDVAQLGQST